MALNMRSVVVLIFVITLVNSEVVKTDKQCLLDLEAKFQELEEKHQREIDELKVELENVKIRGEMEWRDKPTYSDMQQCMNHNMKLSNRIDILNNRLNSIDFNRSKRFLGIPHGVASTEVAFYAHLSTAHSTSGLRQAIKFETVVTNVGNGYEPSDGIFAAPISGVYVFFWNIINDRQHSNIHTSLASSEGVIGNTYTGQPTSTHNEGSGFVVKHLNAGAHVWVEKAEGFGDFLQIFSSFSGFLLYIDE